MKYLILALNKLNESSTWRGLILFATALGVQLEPDLQNHIVAGGLAIVGVINIIRKEPK